MVDGDGGGGGAGAAPLLPSSPTPRAKASSSSPSPAHRRPQHQPLYRKPPRDALLDATFLRDHVDLSDRHLSGFYQALHQQDYPHTLREFLAAYNNNAEIDTDDDVADDADDDPASNSGGGPSSQLSTAPSASADGGEQETGDNNGELIDKTNQQHLGKNTKKKKKRKNPKIQLPRRFLEFLKNRAAAEEDKNHDDDGKKKKNGKVNTSTVLTSSKVHSVHHSANTLTTKLVIELHDGMLVESVIMRYDKKSTVPRASLCVSSQVGCAMACTFCATGTMGKVGNLGVAEILEQVIHANRILHTEPGRPSVRNIVFMGMGEPLDNYNNVVSACKALIDKRRWNLAHGRITVSTVGIVSKIRQLSSDLPEVSLALSLHAPNQKLREAIVPTAHRYPITDLIDALDNHMSYYDSPAAVDKRKATTQQQRSTNSTSHLRKAMIEYVLLQGPTSTVEAAHELGRLCQNRKFVVNLIPYNSTDSALQCPPLDQMRTFRNIVASYGVFCTIRRTMGADIDSACGQLVKKQQQQQQSSPSNGTKAEARDIEDVIPNGGKRSAHARINNKAGSNKSSTVATGTNTARGDVPTTTTSVAQTPNLRQTKDLGDYVEVLAIATALAACTFVASLAMMLRKGR